MTALLYLLKNPLLTLALLATVALGVTAGVVETKNVALANEKASLTQTIANDAIEKSNLRTEKQALQASVETLDKEVRLTKQTQKTLADTMTQLVAKARNEGIRTKETQDAPRKDDAPLAPVLRRALDGLRD